MKNKKTFEFKPKIYWVKHTKLQSVLYTLMIILLIGLILYVGFSFYTNTQRPVIKNLEIEHLEIRYKNNTIIIEDFVMDYDDTQVGRVFMEFFEDEFDEEIYIEEFIEGGKK